ncbi:MAG: sigma 54-interacting transcriptional regulator [Lentisphaeria bacterium]|nr:sigma 54-interacting transcriptional regulator [Lentisphaeria bacterium]
MQANTDKASDRQAAMPAPAARGPRDRQEWEALLRFETLLADLSARFVNVPSDRVDDVIDEAQRLVCECLGLDLSGFWEWDIEDSDIMILTHLYRPLGGPPVPKRMSGKEYFPWALEEMMAGRTIVQHSVDEDTPEAGAVDLATWQHYGIQSDLALPLSVGGGSTLGALTFCTTQRRIHWEDSLVNRLGLVAEIFANAIVRKRSDQALRESEARLTLATDAAGVGLWGLDLETQRYWLTDETRASFGFGAAENITQEVVLDAVCPEDREKVRQTIDRVVASGSDGHVEYRINRRDGAARWLNSWGRVERDPNGRRTLMGVTIDITERKVSEQSLAKTNQLHQLVLGAVAEGILGLDLEGRHIFVNPAAADMLGHAPEDLIGQTSHNVWHHSREDGSPFAEDECSICAACREGREQFANGEVFWRNDGTCFPVAYKCTPVREHGQRIGVVVAFEDITERKRAEKSLRQALDEVQLLRDQLQHENVYLREQIRSEAGHHAIVGESEPVRRMLTMAGKVAPTDSAVFIAGETGTGKELLAQAIHDMSPRKSKLMVKVNCAALPAPLIESELFGREKGAYTGAMTKQVGRFELADGSSIFLDEIGELPLDLQVKLLRVLEDGKFERLGSHQTRTVDVRIISATNRDLSAMVKEGKFREDLFHRLNVFPLEVPPLRERVTDIPLLTWKFLEEFNAKMGRSFESIPKATMERLKQYAWPGNIRELRNVIERAMIVSDGRVLSITIPESTLTPANDLCTLEEMERRYMQRVLERTNWRIRGKGGAAEILGLPPTTLHSRLTKLGISRPAR